MINNVAHENNFYIFETKPNLIVKNYLTFDGNGLDVTFDLSKIPKQDHEFVLNIISQLRLISIDSKSMNSKNKKSDRNLQNQVPLPNNSSIYNKILITLKQLFLIK